MPADSNEKLNTAGRLRLVCGKNSYLVETSNPVAVSLADSDLTSYNRQFIEVLIRKVQLVNIQQRIWRG